MCYKQCVKALPAFNTDTLDHRGRPGAQCRVVPCRAAQAGLLP